LGQIQHLKEYALDKLKHALDRNDLDLYGQEAIIEFGWRLRDTIKFDGLDPLLVQMKKDCDRTRELTA